MIVLSPKHSHHVVIQIVKTMLFIQQIGRLIGKEHNKAVFIRILLNPLIHHVCNLIGDPLSLISFTIIFLRYNLLQI